MGVEKNRNEKASNGVIEMHKKITTLTGWQLEMDVRYFPVVNSLCKSYSTREICFSS